MILRKPSEALWLCCNTKWRSRGGVKPEKTCTAYTPSSYSSVTFTHWEVFKKASHNIFPSLNALPMFFLRFSQCDPSVCTWAAFTRPYEIHKNLLQNTQQLKRDWEEVFCLFVCRAAVTEPGQNVRFTLTFWPFWEKKWSATVNSAAALWQICAPKALFWLSPEKMRWINGDYVEIKKREKKGFCPLL